MCLTMLGAKLVIVLVGQWPFLMLTRFDHILESLLCLALNFPTITVRGAGSDKYLTRLTVAGCYHNRLCDPKLHRYVKHMPGPAKGPIFQFYVGDYDSWSQTRTKITPDEGVHRGGLPTFFCSSGDPYFQTDHICSCCPTIQDA